MNTRSWLRTGLTTLVVLAGAGGIAPIVQAQATADTSASDALTPGDLVRVTVWRKPELSGEFTVTPEGKLTHPLYQDVIVAGMPLAQAKARLAKFLEEYEQNPQIVLEPLLSVSVGGEVRQPNLYPVPRTTTVAQAIARAGGPTERGRIDKVTLVRQDRELHLNLKGTNAARAQLLVRSGDQIVVGKSGNFVRDILTPMASLTAAIVSVVVVFRQ